MDRFRRLLASLACVVVGSASFALSYVALRDEAIRVGAVPSYLGWLIPVVIDGGVICGSSIIWSHSREAQKRPLFPFAFVGILVLVSVIVNVAHAGTPLLAKGIASLPPLILLGTLELVAAQGRRSLEESPKPVEAAAMTSVPMPTALPALVTAQSTHGSAVAGTGSIHVLTLPVPRVENAPERARRAKPAAEKPVATKPAAERAVSAEKPARTRKASRVEGAVSTLGQASASIEEVPEALNSEPLNMDAFESAVVTREGSDALESRVRRTTRKPLRVSAEEPEPLPV